MTIDKMIQKLKAACEEQQRIIEYLESIQEERYYIAPHRQAILENQQLAEWLEELKLLKDTVLYSYIQLEMEKVRNKAIDDFTKEIKEELNRFHVKNLDTCVLFDFMDRKAERLKAGKENVPDTNIGNDGWISVNDRLPDKAGSYLVIGKSGGATVTHWYMPSKLYPDGHFGGNSSDYIRYWMPRPEPPKGASE